MFIKFFYLLRSMGLQVSLDEWLTLSQALEMGLCRSLDDFYNLCRGIVVKSESEYDKLDRAFTEFFRTIATPEELAEYIDALIDTIEGEASKGKSTSNDVPLSEQELEDLKKIRQQDSQIGGPGISLNEDGKHKSAVKVAAERKFRDFREDTILDIRQYQKALKKLRQFSNHNSMQPELDIDRTIAKTCNNGGFLTPAFAKPRQNSIKVILLFDSDGSMWQYSQMCNRLFQAANKSNYFKELRTYYFHNCIYDNLFTTPYCEPEKVISTNHIMQTTTADYRLILVGDASMAPSELMARGGSCRGSAFNEEPGIIWLQRLKRKYPHAIWLNPMKEAYWYNNDGAFALGKIKEIFPMYELSLEGLSTGVKKLLTAK